MGSTFSRQAIPMTWDYAEVTPFGGGSGNIVDYFSRSIEAVRHCTNISSFTNVNRYSSMKLMFESNTLDAVVTDLPYFDSVPYADLSDFFYVWLKSSIGYLYPEHFSGKLTPKKKEAIAEPARQGGDRAKAAKAYETREIFDRGK